MTSPEHYYAEHYYAVIMAGGGGTRLWPLSRRTRPKQLLSLFDERSLFQTAVQRLRGVFPPDHIYVVAVPELAHDLHAQTPEIPLENFLLEPAAHNTAPVIGLSAAVLHQRDPQAVMAVLTADHYIGSEDQFREILLAAHDAAQDGFLVTLGIEPTFASTGFGYIQRGLLLGAYRGQTAYRVQRFKEKPAVETARQMVEAGDHSWNSGMFFWRVDQILKEFQRQMPGLAAILAQIEQAWGTSAQEATLQQVWPATPVVSIDYGIMERAENVAVLPASGLNWSDVGSWESLFDVLDCDANGNVLMSGAHVVSLDTHDCLVYMNREHRLIVTIGVDNLVVVDTGDVLLVCNKDQAQRVRQVVSQLKEEGKEYL